MLPRIASSNKFAREGKDDKQDDEEFQETQSADFGDGSGIALERPDLLTSRYLLVACLLLFQPSGVQRLLFIAVLLIAT